MTLSIPRLLTLLVGLTLCPGCDVGYFNLGIGALYLAMLGMVLVSMLVSLYRKWVARRITRRIREAEQVQSGAFPDGSIGRVVGELVLHEGELVAPLTGRRCAAYEVVVDESFGAFEEGHVERRVAHEVKAVSFAVDDGTGRTIVHPERAEFAITADFEDSAGPLEDPTPRQCEFLAQVDCQRLQEHNSPTVIRFREGVLEPGERVAVLGRGVVSLDASATAEHTRGYRAPAGSTMVTMASDSRTPLYISDDPSVLPTPAR